MRATVVDLTDAEAGQRRDGPNEKGRPGQGGPHNGPDHTDTRGASGARAAAPSERLPWFPWYPGDWLAETLGWPLVARGVYVELLNAQWSMRTLPADPKRLREIVRATSREWRVAWPFLGAKFPAVPGGRQNRTLEARRRESLDLRQRRHAASMRAHAARWGHGEAAEEAGDA